MKRILFLIVFPLLLFSCGQDSTIKIKMENVGGVYMVPAKVNGLPLKFIFDTGASEVSISLTEAIFMAKNGYLEEKDIEGTSFAQLADGSVAENTRIRIKSIEIGELMINDVSATVVHNAGAPLLLGQSAIKKLGRIEFDGDNLIIHTSWKSNRNKKVKIDEKSQAPLDSLIELAYIEGYITNDYMFAQKHIREARQLSISSYITNRNWEIDFIDARVKGELATSVDFAWREKMPLFKSAFHANTVHEDGVCISYVNLLRSYAHGLAQHYSPDDGAKLDDNDMTFEDEFIDVISLLQEKDTYSAYTYSALYYRKNFNVAKSYCEKAISIDSTKSDAYVELGKTYYYTVGDKEQAKKCYEQALAKTDANGGYIHRLWAWCYPDNSNECRNHLKQAALLGDITAQNILIQMGITWR